MESSKKFRLLDAVLYSVCVIFVVDTVAASAGVGVSSFFWWIVLLVLFFVPYGLVTAELGSAFPGEGGIYDWVNKAYGREVAARLVYVYWVNYALWIPAVFYLFSIVLGQIIGYEFSHWGIALITIFMSLLAAKLSTMRVAENKHINNLGTTFKFLLVLAIGFAGIYHAATYGLANDFSLASFKPSLNEGLGFLPVLIFNMLGFELMATLAGEMPNPQKQVPLATVVGGFLIMSLYLFSVFGVLAAIPVAELSVSGGFIDTFEAILGTDSNFAIVVTTILGIMLMYTFVTNVVSWAIGVNFVARHAALNGDLPKMFAKSSKQGLPIGAAYLNALVSTIVIVGYALLMTFGEFEDMFWNIFSLGAFYLLASYLPLFLSFYKLRQDQPKVKRPYKVPGGKLVIMLVSFVPTAILALSLVLFFWIPGEEFDYTYFYQVGGGLVVVAILGEVMIRKLHLKSEPKKQKN